MIRCSASVCSTGVDISEYEEREERLITQAEQDKSLEPNLDRTKSLILTSGVWLIQPVERIKRLDVQGIKVVYE